MRQQQAHPHLNNYSKHLNGKKSVWKQTNRDVFKYANIIYASLLLLEIVTWELNERPKYIFNLNIRISVEENLAKKRGERCEIPQMIMYAIFMSVIRMGRPQVYIHVRVYVLMLSNQQHKQSARKVIKRTKNLPNKHTTKQWVDSGQCELFFSLFIII